MKVSDSVTSKPTRERSPAKRRTGNESNNNIRAPHAQEKSAHGRNDIIKVESPTERKSRDLSRRSSRKSDIEIKNVGSSPNRKPWNPSTHLSLKSKPPSGTVDIKDSCEKNKVDKRVNNNFTTPDVLGAAEVNKPSRNGKESNNPKKTSAVTSTSTSSVTASATVTNKRGKVILKRQLALDNVPTNLAESFSVSDESLNSITSVTQLLKLERSSFTLNGSRQNSNDEEEEEIVSGGVKSIAARWQARNDNKNSGTLTIANQNGILRKMRSNESVQSNKNNADDNSNSLLQQAIKLNGLNKRNSLEDMPSEKQKLEKDIMANTELKANALSSSVCKTLSISSQSKASKNKDKKNYDDKPSLSGASSQTSVILAAAAVAGITKTPAERKTKRAKPSTSSKSGSGVNSNKGARSRVVEHANKNADELSIPVTGANKSKPRSRSNSPTKSSSVVTSPTNKPLGGGTSSQLLLSRGRSSNRNSIDETASPHTIPSAKLLSQDQQEQLQRRRRSRSASSSTLGVPSYAAATATSLAKQTNQIRDHKEQESTRTNKSSTNYHKSQLIKANTSFTNTNTGSLLASATESNPRGQGSQRNAVAPMKNRIRESRSVTRKNDAQQANTASSGPIRNANNSAIKTSSDKSPPVSVNSSAQSPLTVVKKTTSSKVGNGRKSEDLGRTTKSIVSNTDHLKNRTNSSPTRIARRKPEESRQGIKSTTLVTSPKETKPQLRIIPSITMSEYVDEDNKDGKTTGLANTKSLFTPLQFIEPLETSCHIQEGSSLELKVRVKGAEAVVWAKEKKIIPNVPPDFEYLEDRSKDTYGLRIADAFLEDSGLYFCLAFGEQGKEITCSCEVDVLESGASGQDDDDEDISWEDLNMSEEIKSPKPLVVPVIVTSQAEQEIEPSPPLQTAMAKEPSPVRPVVVVKEIDDEGQWSASRKFQNNRGVCSEKAGAPITNHQDKVKQSSFKDRTAIKSSLRNESAFTKSFAGAEQTKRREDPVEIRKTRGVSPSIKMKSQLWSGSSSERQIASVICKADETIAGETVTEFASPNISQERIFSYSEEIKPVSNTATVAVIVHAETDHLVGVNQDHHDARFCKNVNRLSSNHSSSASDESINLKESKSREEDAVLPTEENGASLDAKINVTNDEDIRTVMSEDTSLPSVSSPCSSSEQNERSSSIDSAIGFLGRPLFIDGKFPPRILVGPNNIIALYDEMVHLRVKVQNYGIPKTSVNWFKFVNGTYKKLELNSGDESSSKGDAHLSITKCGTSLSTLTLSHVNYDDCGRYRVKVQNMLGMDSHDCVLTVEGPPEPPGTPPKVKYDDKSKTILIQWSSCPYDGGSKITGYYVEASIVQGSKTAINKDDLDNWQLLTPQSYSWLCYTYTNPKRGSVYRFRVFGENSYGRGKPTEPSLPLLVPVLMEGRRAGSSDALLWSLKSIPQEETSLRTASSRKLVREPEIDDDGNADDVAFVQEDEELLDFKSITIRRESFYNHYEKLDELGKGRFGIVFEVLHKETKKSYAGKFVKCIKAKDKERVQLEVQIMNDMGYHPKLICLIDAFEMPREIVIVTQQINGGELFERVVADDFTLTEGDCITFLRQICDAVRFIHAKNIMHLDLKPENILCTSKDSNLVKIIDFGLAQYYDPKEPIRVLFGTPEFVSPEIINYETIAPSTDNWSIGVITYILLSGLSPFMGDNDNETFSNITRAEFDFEDEAFEKISDDAKDFISNLIIKRPDKRLTAQECLDHRWLKQDGVERKKRVILPTDKLKRFLVRRKWQKTGNAIRALSRMTTLYSRRSSSASTSSQSGSISVSSPPPPLSFRLGSIAVQETVDDNVFFPQSGSSPENSLNNNNNNHTDRRASADVSVSEEKAPLIPTRSTSPKPKFSDPSRSDSGVCDVGSFSSSLNYD